MKLGMIVDRSIAEIAQIKKKKDKEKKKKVALLLIEFAVNLGKVS